MALTKVSQQMVNGTTIDAKDFGLACDGVTNDQAAFRSLWNFLRSEWYDNSKSYTLKISGDVLLDAPSVIDFDQGSSSPQTTYYMCDFPLTWEMDGNHTITATNVGTLGVLFQFGSYDSRFLGQHVRGVKLDTTIDGFVLSSRYQMRSTFEGLQVNNARIGFRCIGCQDVNFTDLKAEDCTTGIRVDVNNGGRVSGSNGSYSYSTSNNQNTNITFTATCQGCDDSGFEVLEGRQITIQDSVVQGGPPTNGHIYLDGGSRITIKNVWLETSGATHRELVGTSNFTGSIYIQNILGPTVGDIAEFDGGEITWDNLSAWTGIVRVNSGATMIADRKPVTTLSGVTRSVILNEMLPIDGATTSGIKQSSLPQGKVYFAKNEINDGDTDQVDQFGSSSTEDKSKGMWGTIAVYNPTASSQLVADFWVTGGNGTTPTVVTDEKIGTFAGIGCSLTSTLAASTPNKVIRLNFANSSGNTLQYEIAWHRYEM